VDILRIRLFGTLELELGERVLPAFATRTAKSLFCYLVLHRQRMFPRAVLLGRLWREQDEVRARANLRTALWRVRSVLEPKGVAPGTYLRVDRDNIGFTPSVDYWLDVAAFEEQCTAIERTLREDAVPTSATIESVLTLYRADLLDELYDDWVTFDREKQRLAYLTALEQIAIHDAERGNWARALVTAQLLLHHDPLREHVHRLVMRCHWRAGDRPKALLQYDACARVLQDEIDATPMRETLALRNAIVREEPDPGMMALSSDRTPDARADNTARSALHELEVAASHIDHARARLNDALRDPRLPAR
jgi:DNA-binding SARP family transcriptional activator